LTASPSEITINAPVDLKNYRNAMNLYKRYRKKKVLDLGKDIASTDTASSGRRQKTLSSPSPKKAGVEMIKFNFVGDNSSGYTHPVCQSRLSRFRKRRLLLRTI
jgi:hypothetical protein